MEEALKKFVNSLDQSDYLVAHNLDFDKPIILSEISNYDISMPEDFTIPKNLCTMKFTIDYVKARHSDSNIEKYPFLAYSNKFPKLEELHEKLFSETFEGAHDALVDVMATFRCLKELKRLRILDY
jgi:DNA polymerase-3 subunit epsilon